MAQSAYGKPLVVKDGKTRELKKTEAFDEKMIQDLVFKNPECLPVNEIDDVFSPLISVCTELNTPVGPLDVLLVSPNGRLTIIETKLWRNPEARRVVVAQILDYAKELRKWSYEDLQREINRRLKRSGNTLFEMVKEFNPETDEADFVDAVSRNLRRGNFLLLLVGDGIREGAIGIADFLSTGSHLQFVFSMVELSIYEDDNIGKLIVPKIILKTVELQRMVVEIQDGMSLTEKSTDERKMPSPKSLQKKEFYTNFWKELISDLSFDDPGQAMPNYSTGTNLFIYLGTNQAWVSAYFMQSQNRVGVYFACGNSPVGQDIYQSLSNDRKAIKDELGLDVAAGSENGVDFDMRLNCADVFADGSRKEIQDFFLEWLNIFVNVYRPRVKRNLED